MPHYEKRILRPDPRTNYAAELRALAFVHLWLYVESGCRPVPIPAGAAPWFRKRLKIINAKLRAREAEVRALRGQELAECGCDLSDPRMQPMLDKIVAQDDIAWRVFERDFAHPCAAPFLENGSYDRQFCNRVIFFRYQAFRRESKKLNDVVAYLNEGTRSRSRGLSRHNVSRAVEEYLKVAHREAARLGVPFDLYTFYDRNRAAGIRYLLEDAQRQRQFAGLRGEPLVSTISGRYDISDLLARASVKACGDDTDAPLFGPRSQWSAA